MLNRYNLQIASFTEEETPYPSSLQFIKVTKEKTIATDGRKLIEVTRPTLPYDEYPDTGHEYKENRDFYLRRDEVKKIERLIPKSPLPILQNIAVSQKEKETLLITTDLENTYTISIRDKEWYHIKKPYPNTEKAYPASKPKVTVKLNAKALKEIAMQVEKFSDEKGHPITISIHDEVIEFRAENKKTGQKMKGLLVTLRDQEEEVNNG